MTASKIEWDEVRVFLAVLRAPSLRVAAKDLGMTHPTVRRRLDKLEARLGLHLFDRRSTGLRATAEAKALQEAAQDAEMGMMAFERAAMAASPSLEGPVRISAPDILLSDLLAADLVELQRQWPRIDLHVEASYQVADLGGREADVAIRLMRLGESPKADLVGTPAAKMAVATYGTNTECWLGWEDENARFFMAQTPFHDLPIGPRMENLYLQRAAALAGGGLSMLPCFMVPPTLRRRTPPVPVAAIWVLMHPDLKRNPRIRLVREALVAALKRHAPVLNGEEVAA